MIELEEVNVIPVWSPHLRLTTEWEQFRYCLKELELKLELLDKE